MTVANLIITDMAGIFDWPKCTFALVLDSYKSQEFLDEQEINTSTSLPILLGLNFSV